jgi:hypothetical protein
VRGVISHIGYNPIMKKGEISAKPVTEDELSPVQAIFLNAYLRHWSARKAAVIAGEDADRGREMLQSLSVVLRERLGEDYMTDEELEMRLIDIARGVGPEYLDSFGFVKFQKLIEDNKTHLIKSVQRSRDGINVTFYDSQRALETIGKTRGVVKGEINRGVLGVVMVDEDEMDRAIEKIYSRKTKTEEVIDGEFQDSSN